MANADTAAPAPPGEARGDLPAEDRPVLEVRYKGLLTAAVLAATLLQILDTTIANVALPHMQSALGATLDTITWVITSYVIAAGIATPITGWLADRVGARPLFLWSVAGFIAASMLCGIATNLEMMVGFRVIQGITGAFIGPLAQALLFNINKKADQPRAISLFSTGIMIGPIAGPVIGGWLTDNFDWRWCFYVNVPTGIACLVVLFLLLPKQPVRPRQFDLFGFAFLSIALAAMQLCLDRGARADWLSSTEIAIEMCLAIGAFWIFGVHLFTSRNPLFPKGTLADRNLMCGVMFTAITGALMMSTLALLPTMMQSLYGYSVIQTGYLMTSRGIGVLIIMPVVSYLAPRIDTRLLIFVGYCIAAGSLWEMSHWTLEMTQREFVIAGLIQGIGLGLAWVPVNLLSFATLPPRYRTEGGGLINVGRSIGMSIGVAVTSSMLARNIQVSHSDLAQHVTSSTLPVDPNMIQSLGSAGDTVMAMADGMVNQQAAMIAYLDDFRLLAFAVLFALPLVWVLKNSRKAQADAPVLAE